MSQAFDFLGNIAVVNFKKSVSNKEKLRIAKKILSSNKCIKTVLEKIGKVKGRLRKPTTKFIFGEKTKEAKYSENNCVFRFNVDTTYFSPRLSNERKEIVSLVKKGESVLVAFAGVAPFSVVIAKNSHASKVVSNELNREANKYGRLNVELNRVKEKVEFWDGDFKKIALRKKEQKFDIIVMARPQLKDTFLKEAFMLSKKGTRIFYYDFCNVVDIDKIVEKIKLEAKKAKKKIKILKVKKAGEIAPYKIRVRVDFRIL